MTFLRRLGPAAITQLAGVTTGLVIAGYLAATRLAGGTPVCLPGGGCETVALSEYSSVAGIPVAVLGVVFSTVLFASVAAWLRLRDRRWLFSAYALSLFGVVFVAYLTYLELFVIQGICQWCVAYAASVVATFAATAVQTTRPSG